MGWEHDDIGVNIDAQASRLADIGKVDEAWYLRGAADWLVHGEPEQWALNSVPMYRKGYERAREDV